jgi:hypothetical protein
MMDDAALLMTMASAGIVGLGIVSAAMLRGWSGWLEVRRLEIEGHRGTRAPSPAAARIELADLRERVRKLEAIANGVDL